jgi:SAM-dependent methyltransferase
VKRWLPASMRFSIRRRAARVRHFGWQRYCPLCRSHVRSFRPGGVIPRREAICPVCDSAERHRLAWWFLQRRTDLMEGTSKRLLHVAPEFEIKRRLDRMRFIDYYSASLGGANVRSKVDITDIPFPDETFDAIYCSHVLEHVSNDRKAMSEFFRVLRQSGWALLQVPVAVGVTETLEDPSVIDPVEREKVFGQADHVRLYGDDYPDRLKSCGFQVSVFRPQELLSPRQIERLGIDTTEQVFFCRKSA